MEYFIVAIVALLVFLLSFILTRAIAAKAQPIQAQPAAVEGDGDAIARRLAGAIRFQTISNIDQAMIDGSRFLGLHAYLKSEYPRVAAALEWETVKDYSLILKWRGRRADRPLALLAHMDVVPLTPGTEGDWAHEAFAGDIDEQFVWGRGAMDMKGHLISVLEAVEELLGEGFQPENDVYLCFGHNEEIIGAPESGARGMMEVLKSRGVALDTVIDEGGVVMDGKNLLGVPGLMAVVGTAEKGYMDVRLTCSQDGGHSSKPPRNTALGVLAQAITRLESSPAAPRLIGTVEAMMTTAGRYMGLGRRILFANMWLFRSLVTKALTAQPLTNALVRTTAAATMASGSPAPNVLPQKAEVVVNMRLLPGDTMEETLADVRDIIGDSRVEISLIKGKNPSAESTTDTDGYRKVCSALEHLYPGLLVVPYLMVGGTDSCVYEPVCKNIYRIAPFLISDDDLKTMHGTNERILKENLVRGATFFKTILRDS